MSTLHIAQWAGRLKVTEERDDGSLFASYMADRVIVTPDRIEAMGRWPMSPPIALAEPDSTDVAN